MRIAIAGAFGFVGKNLTEHFLQKTEHQIRALSRSPRQSDDERLECVTTDLYSLEDATTALEGCDIAIYLVHSMAPNSRLAQGNFQDFDFILADNFARAASANNIKHIIYIGGVIPERDTLSPHLASRLEVEDILRSQDIPVTALRCGLVIGPDGSSFRILLKLVERLPTMILPQWMRTRSSPIYIEDLTRVVAKSIDMQPTEHQIIDAGIESPVCYKDMVTILAKALNKSPLLIDVPYVSPHLSKLWVRLVSGTPKALVYPLIESLRHEMIRNPKYALPADWNIKLVSLEEAIERTVNSSSTFKAPQIMGATTATSEVRSVQRMALPSGFSANDVAQDYFSWLPLFLRPFLKVVCHGSLREYRIRMLDLVLIQLELQESESTGSRSFYTINGGLLVRTPSQGRFEFRESPKRDFVIAALHNYQPALPWPIYRWTQAIIHSVVMRRFAHHLNKL